MVDTLYKRRARERLRHSNHPPSLPLSRLISFLNETGRFKRTTFFRAFIKLLLFYFSWMQLFLFFPSSEFRTIAKSLQKGFGEFSKSSSERLLRLETLSISRKVPSYFCFGREYDVCIFPPCRLLSPVFLVGSQSPKRRWGWGKRSMDPLKSNKKFVFLSTKTSNKSVKHNHQSTRPLYKIIRRENLMGNEREREKELAKGFDSKQVCKWTLPPFSFSKCVFPTVVLFFLFQPLQVSASLRQHSSCSVAQRCT